MRRRRRAEVVDAGVVGVRVVVFYVREGVGIGGDVACEDFGVAWVIAVERGELKMMSELKSDSCGRMLLQPNDSQLVKSDANQSVSLH